MANEYTCSCEDEAHGDLGPVVDSERVARLVTSPNHFRKDGGLKPGAFPLSHIKTSGVSLLRVDLMQESVITEVCVAIANLKPGERPSGVLVRKAIEVRRITDYDGNQAMCVVDDPVKDDPPAPDNEAHAIAISSKARTDEDILEIQSDLLALFDQTLITLGKIHFASEGT
jgi:hypothetical protein